MTIGFDVSDLSTGRADGTTRYTFELAKRLPLLALDTQWRMLAPSAAPADFPSEILSHPAVKWIASPWPKYWTQLRMPFAVYQQEIDVLFMPIQQIPYIRPKKMKTVAVIHDLAIHEYPEQFRRKDWLLLHVFSAYVARQADQIIAVSRATAHDIARFYGREKNVHVVHHGVDHQRFRPVRQDVAGSWAELMAHYPKLHKPYVLYVGQIQPRKNLIRLVEAFEQLYAHEHDLQLVIAGSHGWLQESIVRRIEKSPARDAIVLTGRVTDDFLPALYHHADVFVLPSLYEGFGLPILEAMACGTPVVTSTASCMPEITGEAAILVDPLSSEAIAAGVQEARRNRKTLIHKGLTHAQHFTWDTTAKATMQILRNN
jgi:glycosyltransferase involved in cell wall biosynthesis